VSGSTEWNRPRKVLPARPTKGVNVPYPHSLEHTRIIRPATHPEGSPELSKRKQIAANQQKTKISQIYGEGRVAKRKLALLAATLWYAEREDRVFPLDWVDDHGRCSCNGKPGCKPGKHPWIPNVPSGPAGARKRAAVRRRSTLHARHEVRRARRTGRKTAMQDRDVKWPPSLTSTAACARKDEVSA
jgi:hypothetical protein